MLNVICVYYNFSNFKRRKQLTEEFIYRCSINTKINLFVVELILEGSTFSITNSYNANHLQLTTKYKLWFKENLINIAVNKLLPKTWDNFAWIDSDIEFLDNDWVSKAIDKICCNDIIQLFSKCIQLDKHNNVTERVSTGVIKYNYGKSIYTQHYNDTHPGYAWAMSRNGYEKIGKFPELFIIGSADTRIAYGMLDIDIYLTRTDLCFTDDFKTYILDIYKNVKNLKFDFLDTVIYHYYHGSKENRKYFERHMLLSNFEYEPTKHITHDKNGLIQITDTFPIGLLHEIDNYFEERKEDD